MQGETSSSGFLYWLRVVVVGKRPKLTLIRLGILVVASFVIFHYVLIPIRVTGISMEPTYHDHSLNFINRLAYVYGQPQRGDVVALSFSTNGGPDAPAVLFKRLVGLPGEKISFEDGHVCVDGEPQEEPYLKLPSHWNLPARTLGLGEYYFVGDNRSMDPKDHFQGIFQRSQILGRVLLKGHE